MDGLLEALIASVVFALIIFMISRSVKTIVLIGSAVIAFLALVYFGVLG